MAITRDAGVYGPNIQGTFTGDVSDVKVMTVLHDIHVKTVKDGSSWIVWVPVVAGWIEFCFVTRLAVLDIFSEELIPLISQIKYPKSDACVYGLTIYYPGKKSICHVLL